MQKRIFVIDDDPMIRDLVAATLQPAGYEVSGAANGREALQRLESERPDAILVDMRMPVMDGTAFLAEYLKRPAPHAPIVIFSAAPSDESALGGVAVARIDKPFELDDLIRVVGDVAR